MVDNRGKIGKTKLVSEDQKDAVCIHRASGL